MTALTASSAANVMASARCVFLDFDGPICSIFSDRSAPIVAAELGELLASHNLTLPTDVLVNGDPLGVLRHLGKTNRAMLNAAEDALRAAELAAAETAIPTPGGAEFLRACSRTARTVAVVSNNSGPAVVRYLDRMELATLVEHIEGRIPGQPELMKPNRALLDRASKAVGAEAGSSILIGDSVTDVVAARESGMLCIGYANKPGKAEALNQAGADATTNSMHALAIAAMQTPGH